MDFISAWLKGIILIILFATFMDLLLPSSSMQKYVKLVIGLIIIVTMLTPLLVILNGKDAFTGTDFLDWQRGEAIVASAIDEVSQQVTQNHQDMTNDRAKQMVIKGVQDILYLQGEYKLVDMELQTEGDSNLDGIRIVTLHLIVSKIANHGNTGTDSDAESISELEPNINNIAANIREIPLVQIDSIQINEDVSREETKPTMSDNESIKEIKQMISKQLEISSKSIDIYIVEERSGDEDEY